MTSATSSALLELASIEPRSSGHAANESLSVSANEINGETDERMLAGLCWIMTLPVCLYIYDDIDRERQRAHAKHGATSIEGLPPDDPGRLPILVEEVGEVARNLNDRRHAESTAADLDEFDRLLRAELVQVAAMAVAWIASIDGERGSYFGKPSLQETDEPCRTCGGTGEVFQAFNMEGLEVFDPCPDCDGSGTSFGNTPLQERSGR